MIEGLKPYAKYKDAELATLGAIPSHWVQRRAKYLFREIDERSETGAEEMLSVSHKTGVTPRSQKNVTMFMAESNVGHKLCRPDDVVINTMWAWMAALGVSRHTGLVSPAYGVYRPKPGAPTPLSKYADALLRTEAYRTEYVCRSTGINSSRLRLYPEMFLRIPILVPPPDEQAAIVRFLDHADRQINRYIRAKHKVLTLFAEERERETNDAIRMSGVREMRVSDATAVVARPIDRQDSTNYTPVGLFNRGRGIFHKPATPGAELGDSTFYWIEDGDFILSGQFSWEGAIALAHKEDAGCVASHRYHILQGKPGLVNSAYLYSFFRTGLGQLLLDHHSRGAAGRNRPLNARTLVKEKIPVPPLSAQERIAKMVQAGFDLQRKINAAVGALREYRARLVADVVTGKLDVRDAAAKLPDFTDSEVVDTADDEVFDDDEAAPDDDTIADAAE
jgi:type I restriction enzyme S subunit